MADLSDVEQAIVNRVTATIYPLGTAQPSALLLNSAPTNARVFRDQPSPNLLKGDLPNGIVDIGIVTDETSFQDTTRFQAEWQTVSTAAPTITLTVSGATVTVSGSPTPGQVAAVIVGDSGYTYAIQNGDTVNAIAAGLAVQIPNASASGAVVTIAGATRITVDVSTGATVGKEVARQVRRIHVGIWAGTPALRDACGSLLFPVLADVRRLLLPDGSWAQISMAGDISFVDQVERMSAWRRSIILRVEYPTLLTQQTQTVAILRQTIAPEGSNAIATIDT